MEITTPVAFILGAIIGAIPAMWSVYNNRKKSRADVMDRITQAADRIVEQMEKRDTHLGDENKRISTENAKLRVMLEALEVKVDIIQKARARQNAGIDILLTQFQAEGVKPVWKPKPKDMELRTDDEP